MVRWDQWSEKRVRRWARLRAPGAGEVVVIVTGGLLDHDSFGRFCCTAGLDALCRLAMIIETSSIDGLPAHSIQLNVPEADSIALMSTSAFVELQRLSLSTTTKPILSISLARLQF